MSHKSKAVQIQLGARKDPKKLARPTRIHEVKRRENQNTESEILDEIDEFFASYDDPEQVLDDQAEVRAIYLEGGYDHEE